MVLSSILVLAYRCLFFLMTVSLGLFWLDFFVDVGSYATLFYFSAGFFVLCMLFRPDKFRLCAESRADWAVVIVGLFLIFLALLPYGEMQPREMSVKAIFYFIFLFLINNFWLREVAGTSYKDLVPWALVAFFGGLSLFHVYGVLEVNSRKSFLWNPHYLAHFCILGLAALAIGGSIICRRWVWFLVVVFSSFIVYLLVKTQSRPAWIAIVFGVVLVICLYSSGRYFWASWAALFAVIFGVAIIFPDLVINRFMDLVENVSEEERVYIWKDSLGMLQHVGWVNLMIGSGPGSFRYSFSDFVRPEYSMIEFPHNFFIELVFESGFLGLFSVFFMYFVWFRRVHAAARIKTHYSFVLMSFVGLLSMHLAFTGVVVPFYSRHGLIIQAPLLSAGLFFASRAFSLAGMQKRFPSFV